MKNQTIWNNILDIISQSKKSVKIFDGDILNGEKEFNQLGLQNQKVLESIISNCSGICVDNWIRIYGQSQNFKIEHKMANGMIIIGQDIVGGIFSMNVADENKIYYFAQDNLQWESMDMTYSEFIGWTMMGDTDGFYSTMRWKNWKDDCKEVDFNKMIMLYPFLWAKECNIETASKKTVSSKELMELNLDTALKFDGV